MLEYVTGYMDSFVMHINTNDFYKISLVTLKIGLILQIMK